MTLRRLADRGQAVRAVVFLAVVAILVGDGLTHACNDGSCLQQCITSCDCSGVKPRCYHQLLAGKSECVHRVGLLEEPIFFVHIGKTGGTTFRAMAEKTFGKDRMCLIYPMTTNTSPLVNKLLFARGDHTSWQERVRRFFGAARPTCSYIGGHIAVKPYLPHVGLRRVVSFLREPADRLVSLYFHRERDVALNQTTEPSKTFAQFAVNHLRGRVARGAAPWQRLNTAHIPPQAYGFLGLRERYDESIELFNDAFALDFRCEGRSNTNSLRTAAPPEASVVGPELRALLQADYELHGLVAEVFRERQRVARACQPYVHGAVDGVEGGVLRGSAWWAHSDEAVRVRVLVGGVEAGVATAHHMHLLRRWGAPRNGLVGFAFRLPPSWNGTTVARVEVAQTGQLLGEIDSEGKGTLLWKHISLLVSSMR